MDTIAISKFKATCLAVLERVRRTGMPILVTRRGVPVAQVQPPPEAELKSPSGYGCMRDSGMRLVGDIVAPLPEKDWEVLR